MTNFHKFRSLRDTDYHKGFVKRAPVRVRQEERYPKGQAK